MANHQHPYVARDKLANLKQHIDQDLRDYAEEVLRSVTLDYPDHPEMQDTIAIECVTRGCRNGNAATLVLNLKKPKTFDDAVEQLDAIIQKRVFSSTSM